MQNAGGSVRLDSACPTWDTGPSGTCWSLDIRIPQSRVLCPSDWSMALTWGTFRDVPSVACFLLQLPESSCLWALVTINETWKEEGRGYGSTRSMRTLSPGPAEGRALGGGMARGAQAPVKEEG